MRKHVLAVLIILTVSTTVAYTGPSATTTTSLPEPGTTPGSFWFGFETAMEKIDLALTFNKQKKAEKSLELAKERLSEANQLAAENNSKAASKALENFQARMEQTRQIASGLDQNRSQTFQTKIDQTFQNHLSVLQTVVTKTPETAHKGLRKAIEESQRQEIGQLPVGRPDGTQTGYIATGRVVN